jgi:hypothetical protein
MGRGVRLRQSARLWLLGTAAVLAIGGAVFVMSHRGPTPSAPTPVALPISALPGDSYVDQSASAYVSAVIHGNPTAIQRLRLTTVDSDEVRSEVLGRFVSVPVKSLRVVGVHDERAVSGNGAGKPATSWSAVVTVQVLQGSRPATFGVQVAGKYGANGSVDSGRAESSAQ